jgi:hypothetical protein
VWRDQLLLLAPAAAVLQVLWAPLPGALLLLRVVLLVGVMKVGVVVEGWSWGG